MARHLTTLEFLRAYQAGGFTPDANASTAQIRSMMRKAGWFHWACGDTALPGRMTQMANFVVAMNRWRVIGLNHTRIVFHNVRAQSTRPGIAGAVYDILKIVSIPQHSSDRARVFYAITFGDRRETTPIVVYGKELGNDFQAPLQAGSKDHILRWFRNMPPMQRRDTENFTAGFDMLEFGETRATSGHFTTSIPPDNSDLGRV